MMAVSKKKPVKKYSKQPARSQRAVSVNRAMHAQMEAGISSPSVGNGVYRVLGGVGFNGEKNFGEIGPVKDYFIDYEVLRMRSWQLFLDSDMAQTVLGKYKTWVIGKGLKCQAEPMKRVLERQGIKVDIKRLVEDIEDRFYLWAKSRDSVYSRMSNLNLYSGECFKNKQVGGDVLVILRVINNNLSVQLVDGAHVISPMYGDEKWPQELANGNVIVNGIELSPKGEHVAYYVRRPGAYTFTYEVDRIPARGPKSGMLMAYLVYGSKYRLDNHRGLPLLSVVFETMKKLERYKEATVGAAEEREKIAYTFEHKEYSDGSNPMIERMAAARGGYDFGGMPSGSLPVDSYGNQLADKFAASTNKTVINLPPGVTAKALESKQQLYFKEFYSTNAEAFCAAAQIPPEIAFSKYDSNFSASRAALKDWENTLLVDREDFSFQFLQPIYELFVVLEVLKNNITAPGLLEAIAADDNIVVGAYLNTRFAGSPVPHIDPLKEVNAERAKLGPLGAHLPLTTPEAATEALNGGDSDTNFQRFADELETAEELGLEPIVEEVAAPGPGQGSQA